MKLRRPVRRALLTSIALLCVPVPGHAQSLLLTAEEFAVLAGTAVEVGGAGPTTISNGNVGAGASINGFPPATIVNGTTILGGSIVGQALDDLITARNGLTALFSPAANNLTGQDLSGKTLTPGVYKFDVAAEITLDGTRILTLDAQGQNNVIWVFNIGTSLITAAGAQIQFINLGSNGGADNGLFWNAGTAITFGAGNVIAGNYLAGTNITFGTTLPGEGAGSGRALALAGVSFDGTATLDILGGPGNGDMTGDFTGGLVLNGPLVTTSGYVVLSSAGTYVAGTDPLAPGATRVVLRPGKLYNTSNVSIDGGGSDTVEGEAATLTVFGTNATLTGTNTYSGGTFIDAGTLTAAVANLPTGGDVTLLDSNATGTMGELIFAQPTDAVFTGEIIGEGVVRKQGAGMLVLLQATDADVLLEGGSLLMNGGVGSLTISSGAMFGGEGTVSGNLINNGELRPGFSPGVIVVAGDYTQGPDGTLFIEIASAVSFDQVIVAGTASIAGELSIAMLGGYNPAGESFEVLTAAGGLAGTFDTVAVSAALMADVTYDANTVTVAFSQVPFTTFAGTPNQESVAEAADLSPVIADALVGVIDAAEFPAALNAISPQGFEIWSDIAFARATALADRFACNQVAPGDDGVFYFEASRRRGDVRGDLDVSQSKYRSDAGLVGVNKVFAPDLVLGLLFNYEDTDAGLGSAGSTTEIKSYLLGARAAWTSGDWFVHGLVAYGYEEYKSTRNISFTGTNAVAESESEGRQWLADIVVGHRFEAGRVSFSPFGGLLAGGWKANGFTETGAGGLNATVGDQSARSLQSQLGAELAVDFMVGQVGLRPHVRAAWLHEFSNDSRSMDAAFGGTAFAVDTRKPERDSARLSAGLAAQLSPRTSLYIDYTAQTGDRVRVTSEWRGGVSISF